jgi:hypothetical protein
LLRLTSRRAFSASGSAGGSSAARPIMLSSERFLFHQVSL